MSSSVVFIIGTSRKEGNTWQLLNHVNRAHQARVIDLSELNISYYDYDHKNIDDDFIGVVEEIQQYKTIGFVSPVYWYSVSAQMKAFIDRFSDLLTKRKDLGRALAGKNTFLLATGGTDEDLPKGMEDTIRLTSNYMDMEFLGSSYVLVKEDFEFSDTDLQNTQKFVDSMSEIPLSGK